VDTPAVDGLPAPKAIPVGPIRLLLELSVLETLPDLRALGCGLVIRIGVVILVGSGEGTRSLENGSGSAAEDDASRSSSE